MKRHPDTGCNQGRLDPRSLAASRAAVGLDPRTNTVPRWLIAALAVAYVLALGWAAL